MDTTQKMLQKIINGQSAMKSELLTKIDGVGERVDKLDIKLDGVEKRLTARIDKIGLQVAELEDDTPTQDEFDNLEGRVKKVERKVVNLS